jgi:arsenite-transporting ATPase
LKVTRKKARLSRINVPLLTFFSGKGGVGKTTCAAAKAAADAAAGSRVLVVSTDPAHSLGDVLGAPLSIGPRRVRSTRGVRLSGALHASEIDARRAFARWLTANQQTIGDIVERGTWLDREDVDAFLGLSIPGIDELVGLSEVIRLADDRHYDEVIVDTAPTGHTLRLLAAPATVATLAHALDTLYEQHRVVRDQLARVGRADAADRLIELLTRQATDMAALLRDRRKVTFHWVTAPEDMSLAETQDGIEALESAGLHVSRIIINRVAPDGRPCAMCDRRRAVEDRVIDRIRRRLALKREIHVVPGLRVEPRGVAALVRIGKYLSLENRIKPESGGGSLRKSPDPEGAPPVFSTDKTATVTSPESLDVLRDARLLFFGGKGGVGKTTAAAAVALTLARAAPGRLVLLLSTDPAHSLGDVLGQSIGDAPRRIRRGPGNLYVREVDAAAALASRRAGLERALGDIAAAFGAGGMTTSAAELMELAPPGIDELFGLVSVVEEQGRFPLIVMDTAPTGHALRLLETPAVAREWVQALLRVLFKYRSVARPGILASELVTLSKSIRELQDLLRSPRDARFLVVTRAAAAPRLETERLLRRLHRLRISAPAVIVNAMTLAPGHCAVCRATAAAERRELARLRRATPRRLVECAIIQTPLAAPPPRGSAALERWASLWTRSNRGRGR